MARVRTYQVGSGITAENRRVMDMELFGPAELEELKKAFQELPDRLNRPWGTKAPLITALRIKLADIEGKAPDREDYAAWQTHFRERESEGWFVLMAVKYANLVERCVDQGRAWEAVSVAFEIGALVTELAYKMDLEPAALVGARWLETAGSGAKARRKNSDQERYNAVMRYRAKGLSLRNAFIHAGRELSCSPSAAKASYYAIKNSVPNLIA